MMIISSGPRNDDDFERSRNDDFERSPFSEWTCISSRDVTTLPYKIFLNMYLHSEIHLNEYANYNL
jgi:hypothetical protein